MAAANRYLTDRLETLRRAMHEDGLAGMVLHEPAYIAYFTGWFPQAWSAALAVIGENRTVLVAAARPDNTVGAWDDFLMYGSDGQQAEMTDAIREAVSHIAPVHGRIAGLIDTLPAALALAILDVAHLADGYSALVRATLVKDEAAQNEIRRRVRLLDAAFEAVPGVMRAGCTEIDVYNAAYTALTRGYGAPISLACNLASGTRTLEAEPGPTAKPLRPGDLLFLDLYPQLGAYAADYTRVFVAGWPSADQLRQHASLEKALRRVEESLRPGVSAGEIDRICRASIEEDGFGAACYRHHTGHGFGVVANEAPWIIPDSPIPLKAGMAVAIEPGIYHPFWGGMRLEGNYFITAEDCESLAGYPAVLTGCGGW